MKRWFNQSWVGAVGTRCILVLSFMLMALMPINGAWAKSPVAQAPDTATVALADLPKQARETYALILASGPFPYEKDGTVFGNRERILPAQKRGFYREYTVKTPYARTRGAKRIVCGGMQASKPEVCYYTEDHYSSFKRIAL